MPHRLRPPGAAGVCVRAAADRETRWPGRTPAAAGPPPVPAGPPTPPGRPAARARSGRHQPDMPAWPSPAPGQGLVHPAEPQVGAEESECDRGLTQQRGQQRRIGDVHARTRGAWVRTSRCSSQNPGPERARAMNGSFLLTADTRRLAATTRTRGNHPQPVRHRTRRPVLTAEAGRTSRHAIAGQIVPAVVAPWATRAIYPWRRLSPMRRAQRSAGGGQPRGSSGQRSRIQRVPDGETISGYRAARRPTWRGADLGSCRVSPQSRRRTASAARATPASGLGQRRVPAGVRAPAERAVRRNAPGVPGAARHPQPARCRADGQRAARHLVGPAASPRAPAAAPRRRRGTGRRGTDRLRAPSRAARPRWPCCPASPAWARPRQAARAEQAALALMERGVARPGWAEHVGAVAAADCYVNSDPFGDRDEVVCVFSYAGEEPHALVVVVDYNAAGMLPTAGSPRRSTSSSNAAASRPRRGGRARPGSFRRGRAAAGPAAARDGARRHRRRRRARR